MKDGNRVVISDVDMVRICVALEKAAQALRAKASRGGDGDWPSERIADEAFEHERLAREFKSAFYLP